MSIDSGKYQKAPNGIVNVLKPAVADERLQVALQRQLQEGKKVYVAQNNEVAELNAALKAGLPVALIGPPGVGKTTLVHNLAVEENLPLGTVMGTKARLWEVVGAALEYGNDYVYNDGTIALHSRATSRSILYLDEAVEFPPEIFTSLSSMLDQRASLYIKETGEALSTAHLSIVLAFNAPTIDYLDKLPTPATLDRLVVIRFGEHSGQDMLRILKIKYGLEKDPQTGELHKADDEVKIALKKHGKNLASLYDDMNSKVSGSHESVVIKRVTTRSAENALKLIAAGLSAPQAATIAMINPMVPVEDGVVKKFLESAKEVVQTWLG